MASVGWTVGTRAATLSDSLIADLPGIASVTLVATATPGPVTAVSVTPNAIELNSLGDTVRLIANAQDVFNNPVTAPVAWTSTDPNVVTVDSLGLTTAMGEGTTTVSAASGASADTVAVIVLQLVNRVQVTPSIDTLTLMGATRQFTAQAFDGNDSLVAGVSYLWLSSNHNVALVSPGGLASPVANGTAIVTAAGDGVPGNAVVVVDIPVASVVITPSSAALTVGDTLRFAADPQDALGVSLTGRIVTWSTDNPAVATVNVNGLVTVVGQGSATISATSETVIGTAVVTVS